MNSVSTTLTSLSRRLVSLKLGSEGVFRTLANVKSVGDAVVGANRTCTNMSSWTSRIQRQQSELKSLVNSSVVPIRSQAFVENSKLFTVRSFATNKNKRTGNNNNNKKRNKVGGSKQTDDTEASPSKVTSNVQHEEWVSFQQSIAVQGFNTGQTTSVTKSAASGIKTRGGSGMRRRREKEKDMMSTASVVSSDTGTGQFPALRYSDEETQRLLAEAYANIPKRTGKRCTRNLKRQSRRWFVVRKNRSIKKIELVQTHSRRMEKRSKVVRDVLAVKAGANDVRAADRQYQEKVLQRWKLLLQDAIAKASTSKESAGVSV